MMSNQLQHHGTRGMKWGIRRYQNKDGSLTPAGKRRYAKEKAELMAEEKALKNRKRTQDKIDKLDEKRRELDALSESIKRGASSKNSTRDNSSHNTIKSMSDDEIRKKIERIELEKKYEKLLSEVDQKSVSKGKQFALKVLEKSGDNIATQVTTYVMGRVANAALEKVFGDPNAVNPKKGQKDK